MSGNFIVEYAGLPQQFDDFGGVQSVDESEATRFICEGDGWLAAARTPLSPNNFRVVNLYERNQQIAKSGESKISDSRFQQ